MKIEIISKLYSKNNTVYLCNKGANKKIIRKIYATKQALQREIKELFLLREIATPQILEIGADYLDIEYIDGKLFIDSFLEDTENELIQNTLLLTDYIKDFCKIRHGVFTNDENFRNYVIENNRCYRIDLENITVGSIEQWLSQLVAFAILYNGEISRLKLFVRTLLEPFALTLESLSACVEGYLINISQRREQEPPLDVLTLLMQP